MASRKDNKGRALKEGESQRKDGRYMYRYTDDLGKRHTVYAIELPELRKKEKEIQHDIYDDIVVNDKTTLNNLFDEIMKIKVVKRTTKSNYIYLWDLFVRNEIGQMKVNKIKQAHVSAFYKRLSPDYTKGSILNVNKLIYSCFEFAVTNSLIRSNPIVEPCTKYGTEHEKKVSLTVSQEKAIFDFISNDNSYRIYVPLLKIMIGTGLRIGELTGLTWEDVDLDNKMIYVNTQLIYRNFGDGYKYYRTSLKTKQSKRVIPINNDVYESLLKIKDRNKNYKLADKELGNLVFYTKNGKPYGSTGINRIFKNIENAYNKSHKDNPIPHFTAHTMRHTCCTRMAENGVNMKVAQVIMGHSRITTTLDVYTRILDDCYIRDEFSKINAS